MRRQHEEFIRGFRESRAAIAMLQARWPRAFPENFQLARPLVVGVIVEIAAAMEWSKPYTRAVLKVWKGRDRYCRAVLGYPHRYDLSGSVTGELVEDQAREQARQQLAKNAAAREQRQQKEAERAARPVVTAAESSI